ncbi:hypothetical protein [Salinicoccus roseus]|uniref:hypothetical protein n=1 Tax=Salinicoccus roseus TaxID=45670 RepID=UPI0023002143|nr:hypothetical protein [Salinicoccus roseus]
MNTGRIMAIFEKDLKEFTRNAMLFTTILLPIILAFMYSRMGGGEEALPAMLVYLIVGVAFSAILCSGIMTMMAEENEKDTLRGLMQSPASMLDIGRQEPRRCSDDCRLAHNILPYHGCGI